MNAMFEKRKDEDFVRSNVEPHTEFECKECRNLHDTQKCSSCYDGSKFQKHTNADRIRSMSDEELAEFLHNFNDCDCCLIEICNEGTCGIGCTEGILKWMKSEAKE